MSTRSTREFPAALEVLRQRFEQWRNTRKARERIPGTFWADAAKMANLFGLHRTARTLCVNYYTLKRLLERSRGTRKRPRSGSTNTFVELPSAPISICDFTLELEDASGSKMRVHLKAAAADVTALCRSLWN